MGMYSDVCLMNEAFGNFAGDPLNPDWGRLRNQCLNILDEYNELFDDGINKENMDQFRDAICDLLVFTMGAAHMAGIPVKEDMKEVFRSNMTKFCGNQDIVDRTKRKYDDLGVATYVDGEFPYKRVKSLIQQTGNDGKLYQAGKMLKGVLFEEPSFKSLA